MKKILITGGAGFIGSNLTKNLHKNNEITIVDDLSMGKISNIEKLSNVTFYENSVLDKAFMGKLLIAKDFDYIFHLAAIASVADSIDRPTETHSVNFESTLLILEILRKMKKRNLKRLVFASSAAVYGDDKELPKKENSAIKPMTPYAMDKFSSEQFVLMYNNLYNIPTSAVRFFNVYGPNQNPSSSYSGVISIIVEQFINELNKKKSEFNLFGDGEQTRDFVYVSDVVKALNLVAHSAESLGKIYNVGTGIETSINDLITIISNILNASIVVNQFEERSGDIKKSVANITKLKNLNFENSYTVKKGLTEYLNYLELIKSE